MVVTPNDRWIRVTFAWIAVAACWSALAASAQNLAGADLEQALRRGGNVLVIANAESHDEAPAERERAPANLKGERELDQHGQGQMLVIGYAFRQIKMHIDDTLAAPAYRSRQSATYLGFGKEIVVDQLAETADASWLARRVTQAPTSGRNTVLVADAGLIAKALARDARGLGNAETLIYRPRDGGADLVARLTVEDWAKLAVNKSE